MRNRKLITSVPFDQMVGHKFGRLTVLARADSKRPELRWPQIRWLVVCECGIQKEVDGNGLRNGNTKSCGCLRVEVGRATNFKHGGAPITGEAPEYVSWRGMVDRCSRSAHKSWKNYGGRGIQVCARWRDSYEAFLADMGRKPTPQHSIDRYPDNGGNYEPTNCRWATPLEQTRNRRPISNDRVSA